MSESQLLFVVVNNAAARARLAWPRVREALTVAGVPFDAHESSRPGETEERTRAALAASFRTVAVVGGDGTLSAAASGYFEPCDGLAAGERPRAINAEAALAMLPAGTGDDFARGLAGGRRDTLEAWLTRLVAHCREQSTTRSVDVLMGSARGGARNRFLCLNAATIGIGAEVASRVASQGPRARRLPGELRFAWAALPALAAQRRVSARVSVDGEVRVECGMNLVAVANGPFAGGGMNFAPEASASDGLLDVVTVCRLSRAGLLRELARIHRGGHLANPKVKVMRGACVRVETLEESASLAIEADGDVRGRTPVEFSVMPAALRVVF
ncbi:MAG TPA: diacylglycerol kinase family protein [Pyrinomonadaceae bacterium]|nr:diacylglycerol kinase family protein [Pyrinomonadaceae bacterium]